MLVNRLLRKPIPGIPYKHLVRTITNDTKVSAIVLRPIVKSHNNDNHPKTLPELHLAEAVNLVESLGWTCSSKSTVPIREINPATFLGKGKVEEVNTMIHGYKANAVIVDTKLSPVQSRNLSDTWGSHHKDGIKVLDRFGLILEIFASRAQSKESKLQVELASLAYRKTRLIDTAKMASEKQTSGVGKLGGFGETRLELDRRKINEREKKIKHELEGLSRARNTARSSRSNVPVVALVGYTNAGKSALINRLSGSNRESTNQYFTSLDPHSYGVVLPSGKKIILTDTVGFISELPNILATAFKSTLEEALNADLLLHVRDISIPNPEFQKKSVLAILKDLKCNKKLLQDKYIEACNKIDLLEAGDDRLKNDGDQIFISATNGTNCDQLLKKIEQLLKGWQPDD